MLRAAASAAVEIRLRHGRSWRSGRKPSMRQRQSFRSDSRTRTRRSRKFMRRIWENRAGSCHISCCIQSTATGRICCNKLFYSNHHFLKNKVENLRTASSAAALRFFTSHYGSSQVSILALRFKIPFSHIIKCILNSIESCAVVKGSSRSSSERMPRFSSSFCLFLARSSRAR